ncbi:thioether cross-link-forming SCIFF peptide maturase [Ruminococcus flavefaciens]|uniref:thioether cross-link-forming SCIFF peptide maturase n=1 Tax=Ruminococcus flavefaciens TaxID=1265 RepID=UPI0026F11F20|nr:thioether cross-link-forming SCIFF peptide maturase [Ruminococcus flavefaciens]MDD7516325.1 thioether cross-link-forming SCIFF peptide maturase [Ruminococcus flavefaciens]MDY5691173.1 thioether cross-link-forming SCIFF peptide maturase [Ruminococcus flavefaciens]
MIHKYKLNGLNIVLDVNSGGVHLVDELTYDLLDNVEPPFDAECPQKVVDKLSKSYDEQDIRDCYDEIVELYNDKILFSEDDYEKYAQYSVASPVKAMCLNIAHDCQLRCKYCFASTGDFGKGRKLMSFETGKHAIDFLLENSGNRPNLELDFFGGEPLMNFGVVKQVVEYARSREKEYNKKFRFTITTNGLLLDDEKIEFINREMSNVVLSIDGRKEVNDYFRVLPNGQGCYDIILPKYKKLVEGRGDKEYYVRGTFTNKNLDFSKDVFALNEAGFDQISVEPVVGDDDIYALTEKDLPAVFAEYEKLALKLLENEKNGKKFNFFHFMLDLDQGPCAIKRLRGCGCGNDYVAITPDGDIFPCHQFVGIDEYKMGNIDEGTFDQEMKADFAKAHVYSKPECRECWAKFYCSGGCNANNYQYMGDIRKAHKISCQLEKKRLECAIMMKAIKMADTAE